MSNQEPASISRKATIFSYIVGGLLATMFFFVDGGDLSSIWVQLALLVMIVLGFPGKVVTTIAFHLHPDTTGYEIPIVFFSMCFYWLIAFIILWIVRMSED